jgi:uncharacterized protein YoxC
MGKSQDYIIRLQAENHKLKQKFAETQGTARKFTASMATMGKQAAGSLGLFFGVGALAMGISSSIRKIADFEFQMDKVAAVSRASAEEVKALKDNALALGASTKFTATEIGKMQEEIARLGFTSSQIVDTTDSIRKLATVADTELGEAAKVMVKTLNAFNLSAKESERVANVMAESFSMSALDMEGFGTAMAYAGTAGKTFGLNIEQVTAMIGTLIDSGIQAQKAGSGLRDIFADLAIKGITLKEAYDQVNKSANKSVTANKLVGKTSSNQLIILAEQQEKTERLTEAFSDQTKEMNAMVGVMEDNLITDWKLFTSAIDGLVQKGGALNGFFRDLVQGMTDAVNALNEFNKESINPFFEDLKSGESSVSDLNSRMEALNATITASGRKATQQREAVRGEVNSIKEAIEQYEYYTKVQNAAAVATGTEGVTIKSLTSKLDELKNQLDNTSTRTRAGREENIKLTEALTFQIDATIAAIDSLKKLEAQTVVNTGVTNTLKKSIGSLGELTGKGMGALGGGISAQPMVLKDGMKEIGGELNAEAQLQMDTFNGIMKSGVIDGLGAFADGLATGGLKGAFQGLFQVIGGGLQTLGKSLIAFGFSMEAFKKAFTNPIAAIAAGAAAIAAGAFVKNAASNLSSSVGGGGGASYGGGGGSSASISQQSITIEVKGKTSVSMKELSFALENFKGRDARIIGR